MDYRCSGIVEAKMQVIVVVESMTRRTQVTSRQVCLGIE